MRLGQYQGSCLEEKKILLESQKFRKFRSEKNPIEYTLHPQISIVHPYRRNLLVLDK